MSLSKNKPAGAIVELRGGEGACTLTEPHPQKLFWHSAGWMWDGGSDVTRNMWNTAFSVKHPINFTYLF